MTKNDSSQKAALYQGLTELLLRYTDLAEQLAHEYRYAFNHADKLTLESEEAAEEIITALENTEKQIREKTSQLMLTNGSGLAQPITDFLLPERNKRHASPRDLEKYTETARQQSTILIQRMREDLEQTSPDQETH